MGYRSDVAIAIHKDLQGDFLTFLTTTELMAHIFGDMSDFHLDKDYHDSGHWLFTCNGVKWYSSYKDIQTYEAIFKMLEEKKIDYDFVRLGEENTDNELHTQKKFFMSRNYEVI